MRISINKLVLLLIFVITAMGASAAVSEYAFTGAAGTYTEITGGTVLGTNANDDESFNAIPLGFTFTYNGVAYDQISIQTDAFLAFGPTVTNSTLAISSATGTNNIVAAMNRDLMSRDTGELSYLLTGTAPSRVFTIQWKNYRRVPTTAVNDIINFQIQLHESGNMVRFSYGAITVIYITTARTVQVGLRGDSNADFNNRTTQTDWAATTAGTANNANCYLTDAVYPPLGYMFTFSPAQQGTPPLPAQNPVPANSATNVSTGTNLTWTPGGGTVTGYKLYFGTDNPPTNLVNGTTQTGTMYDPAADLSYNTAYYWKVVPFNTDGDALDCPVWQFTTLADPTVTTYPYNQNFDTPTPPALPLGWTALNANADTYTWETNATNPQDGTNSARIRYNATLEMNDWLISPPLHFTADMFYSLNFFFRAHSATYPEKLSVYWGSAPTAAAMTNLLWENNNIINTTYEEAEAIITATTTGNFYIGFHGHSAINMFYLYLDTITIDEFSETIDPPTNLQAAVTGNNVHLTWTAPGGTTPPGFSDGFETYADFSLTFDPWVTVDVDQSTTYGMTGITWANAYAAQAYMIFNPSATVPPVTDLAPHTGSKMAACFASTTPPNNDWLISPLGTIQAGQYLNFWAKSYTAQYGLERFKVGISMGGTAPADFTIISGANYVQAPVDWTLYSYDLSAYAGQSGRFGIQCLSNDAFIFLVDDVTLGPIPTAKTHDVALGDIFGGKIARNTGAPVPGPAMERTVTRDLLGYKVYRDGSLIGTVTGAATTSYDDPGLAVGTYSYTVTAFYTAGESTPAGPVTATINPPTDPPTDLVATVTGNDVVLNWTSPETPQTGEWITWCQDVLGNSVGTNAAAVFDVAHRYAASDLIAHQGGTLTQVKFVPAHQACVYTVKVWTGGSATNAGTLVSSQVVPTFTLDDWNLVVLNTPVPIPATGELWIGFESNTQGGYPAGCDSGPQIEGKGNMMYYEGAWATLTALAPTLTYNWLIQGFVADGVATKAVELSPIAEHQYSSPTSGTLAVQHKIIDRDPSRALTGFKVYRDAALIGTINDPAVTTFADNDLPNGTYTYGVSATYTTGESTPATVQAVVNVQLAETILQDSFEAYPDFSLLFAPWTLLDVDLAPTYGITDITFPGSAGPMAYIVFNPSTTVPPLTTMTAHTGSKMAASFAATTPPNNDWMITTRINLGTQSAIKFWAKSHTAQYGLERFRVGISTLPTIIPQGFQYITGPDHVEAPTAWTEYVYDLSAYDGQSVYIGIRCVSNDAFIFFVDDFSVHSNGGTVPNDDNGIPSVSTALHGNYPNPFNPETNIRFSLKEASPVSIEIYNVKGQLVRTLLSDVKEAGNHTVLWNGNDDNNRAVSSGVYFYKMNAGKYSSTRKMILMK